MTLWRVASPFALWYCRASFITVSTASEPRREVGVEVPGRYLGDLGRKLQAPRVLEAQLGKSQLLHLPRRNLAQLRPAVPDRVVKSPASPSM